MKNEQAERQKRQQEEDATVSAFSRALFATLLGDSAVPIGSPSYEAAWLLISTIVSTVYEVAFDRGYEAGADDYGGES